MRFAPPRISSVAAVCFATSSLALGAVAGCQLNTTGITDPGTGGGATRGGLGGDPLTPVRIGSGGSADAGSAGGARSSDATGGASGTGGNSGAGGTNNGSGGTAGTITVGTGGSGAGGTGTGGSGTGGSGTGGTGTGGSGGSPPTVVGCADGTREAFADLHTFPTIAGCAGGWSVAGIVTAASMTPGCARAAGNNGARPLGTGCTVEDLCAAGWHVCLGANELGDLNVSCANSGIPAAAGPATRQLFATRQRGRTGTICTADDATGTNDVHGCGNFGLAEDPNCAPLDRQFSHTECDMVSPWFCNDPASATGEALVVIKPGSTGGGVLCCHN